MGPMLDGDEPVARFERAAAVWSERAGAAGVAVPVPPEVAGALLVEGASDRAACREASRLLGVDPAAAGVAILPMGGAMSVRRFVSLLRPAQLRLHGLCDAGEAAFFERAGLDETSVSVCRPDLEGELLRALGAERAEAVLAREGDLGLFRTFQRQPAQRERPVLAQLHRFLGTTSGRKEQYGRALTEELGATELPTPLREAVESVLGG
ncbi:TOPRIM nucleotidyl transferase/hydrolase domain-containing protein [Leifsonia sp. EB34]|uniref:TOPRIM nucleotidyl transferase/hydrolase domain-containing protein n=1 Tax=Leifsonia sp. EB34 TaxID=3156303 RepID=UPI003515FEDE